MENADKETFENDAMIFNFEALTHKEQKYFRKISEACNKIINDEIKYRTEKSRKYISQNSISKITKITRPTIASYDVLVRLIDFKAKILKKIDPSESILKLKNENLALRKQILKMVKRDVEIQNLREENQKLKNQIKCINSEKRNLENLFNKKAKREPSN